MGGAGTWAALWGCICLVGCCSPQEPMSLLAATPHPPATALQSRGRVASSTQSPVGGMHLNLFYLSHQMLAAPPAWPGLLREIASQAHNVSGILKLEHSRFLAIKGQSQIRPRPPSTPS